MKMIYALPLAFVAALAISGCSKHSGNSTPAPSQPAMQNAPSSTMSTHPQAMPAQPKATPAPASSAGKM